MTPYERTASPWDADRPPAAQQVVFYRNWLAVWLAVYDNLQRRFGYGLLTTEVARRVEFYSDKLEEARAELEREEKR